MTGTCACCDQPGKVIAHGWREACYSRWIRAGRPADGPPAARLTKAERLADYAFLVSAGEHPAEAGRRLGLEHERTIRSYETERKAKSTSTVACACCARHRPIKARGWCTACYMRWCRAGRPDTGPPAPTSPRQDTTINCDACGQTRKHVAHGWCTACYMRWFRAGQPAGGPPPPSDTTPVITCAGCQQNHRHVAKNLCQACYTRWIRAGRPATCPPPRHNQWTPETLAAAIATRRANRDYRISEYAFLISSGETRENAAQRIGISMWTAEHYDKALRERTMHGQEAA